MSCTPGADDVFGPTVSHGCRDGFDFTLLFEQSFMQIVPCALLLLIVPVRISQLRKQNVKVLQSYRRAVKQSAILLLGGTQLALLILWSLTPMYRTKASIPAAVLSLLASIALLYLSSVEHTRSVRPSSLINFYMLITLVLDLPQTRTLWLRTGPRALPTLFTAGVAAKAVVLYLEACSKRKSLAPAYRLSAPEALVSLYDRTALWWVNPLFWKGYRSFLSIDKLYAVDADLCSEQVERTFHAAWARQPGSSSWAIVWAVARSVKSTFLGMVIPRLCLSALKLCQPLLIARMTTLLGEGINDDNANIGRGLIGAAALIYLGVAITTALYQRELHRLITKIRGYVVTAVYSKSLKVDSKKLADNDALTLVTADVNRVCMSLQNIDDLFATPIEIGVAIYLLKRQIGVSCVAPVAFSLAITAISFVNSNTAIPMQKGWLAAVSERVAYTSSVLGAPKAFKLLGLTPFFTDHIQGMRVKELALYAAYRKYVVWRNVFSHVPIALAPPLTLMMFALINGGQSVNQTTAFTTLALVALLTTPIQQVIHAVPQLQTALASLQRVQTFLHLDEIPLGISSGAVMKLRVDEDGISRQIELQPMPKHSAASNTQPVLRIEDAIITLGDDYKQVLSSISIQLMPNKLHVLLGPVGSGKSTLLKAVIGDVLLTSGSRVVQSSGDDFAFCAQDPWLPNDTVRNLICGHSDFDPAWYAPVVAACALIPDIATFPAGDDALIGTKGVSLSGGQRQRLSLARALYARKKILVVDDILSGLDASTSRQVFTQVFGKQGLCKAQGLTVILATHAQQYLPEADHIIALRGNGSILEQGTFKDLDAGGGYIHQLRLASDDSDPSQETETMIVDPISKAPDKVDLAQQDLARKTGDRAVYSHYLKSIGWTLTSLFFITSAGFAFGHEFPALWVRYWSEDEASGNSSRPLGLWIGIYFLIAVSCLFSAGASIWVMLVYAVPKSSAQLHKQLLDAVMRAPYSFFVNTDSGITLNRFSNDMSLIETELVGAFMQFGAGAAIAVFSAALIVAGADYAAVTIPFLLLVLYGIQKFYLRTSRQLRFLELESQAPLLTHCSETIAGVTTIRAFGWQHQSHQKCHELLDRSQRAYYLMLCIQRWLTFVLSLVTAAIGVIVVSMAMTIPSTSSAGAIGVSLLGILGFTSNLAFTVNAWTSLETSLGAVARCRKFETSTASEDKPEEEHTPPPDWPHAGSVVVRDMSATYNAGDENVLKSISLSLQAGEKVGICGRSGSGKSSLLLTLFRLLDYNAGSIEIDGVDLSSIPRQLVRERCAVLPQEAITFPGTLHTNLDPLNRCSADEAEDALRKVGLHELVAQRGGLEAEMSSMSFSQGQMQLFAVARALLRKSKLLVLDEMTSSVDAVTEELMMRVIKEDFSDSTVVAVAHRIKTIINFDRIVVMDTGRVVENGSPEELLSRPDGVFKTMWERSGQH